VSAASAVVNTNVLTISGGAVGFAGANDANIEHSLLFNACSYSVSTGVVLRNAAKIAIVKDGSWNEADVGTGTRASLVFSTNNGTIASPAMAERMRISSSGNIGIGTTASITKLSVHNSTETTGITDVLTVTCATTNTASAGKGAAIRIGRDPDGNYSTKIATVYEQSNPSYLNPAMVFYTMYNSYLKGSEIERMRITSAGRVNISNKPNSGLGYAVLIDVGTGATGDVGYQTLSQLNTNLAGASDIRFKKNIKIIPNAIEKIKTINGYTFDWDSENEDYNYSEKEGRDAGIIAQEIQKVLPEIVQIATVDRDEEGKSTSGKNYLSVDYKKIIPLLIQGIKEQETSIQELEARIKELENK
jgi:hypothetical protein